MAETKGPPIDARTVQWAVNGPVAGDRAKSTPASIGACDACRARKVRCLASENTMSNKCQRCARAGRECVYTVHCKTRRRKRTDTRVKELEEKVRDLSLLLGQGQNSSSRPTLGTSKLPIVEPDEGMNDEYEDISDDNHEDEEELQDYDGTFNGTFTSKKGAKARTGKKSKRPFQPPISDSQPSFLTENSGGGSSDTLTGISPDVIERGLLTMKEAAVLFDLYVNDLSPNYPAIIMSPDASAAEIRLKRPILFLAVIAAAAGTTDPALNLKLNQEILQVYATKVALQGQKGLDLVQSILISSLWYYPPERFDQLKFYQYIHMAATMALDLGLGKRPKTRRQAHQAKAPLMQDFEPQKMMYFEAALATPARSAPDSSLIECRRTLLACYLRCSSVSISLRLPNAMRFTSYMGECLDVLETSPEAAPTDRRFAAWIRIERIVEEYVNSLSLDDSESTVSLKDIRVQSLLRGYEKQMEDWRRSLKPGVLNAFLDINFHCNNVYMHEIGLHPDHDPEDFRPPFYVGRQLISKIPAVTNPAYVNAIMECVSSAQTVLSIFLEMKTSMIRALPALVFVRVTYCCVILIKLEFSSSSPASELGKVLDSDSLRLPTQLQKVLDHQVAVVGTEGKYMLGGKFLMILQRVISWYHNYKVEVAPNGKEQKDLEPGRANNSHYRVEDAPAHPAPPVPVLDMLQQPNIPNFDISPPPAGQSSTGFLSAPDFAPKSNTPEPPMQQNSIDFHQVLLNAIDGSPSGDHSSPGSGAGLESNSPEMEHSKMEVDPKIFGHLQGMGRPFSYNPDPNDWLFDGSMMDGNGIKMGGDGLMMGENGIGMSGVGDFGVPGYEWAPGGMQQ